MPWRTRYDCIPSFRKERVRMYAWVSLFFSPIDMSILKQRFGKMRTATQRYTRRPLSASLGCATLTFARGNKCFAASWRPPLFFFCHGLHSALSSSCESHLIHSASKWKRGMIVSPIYLERLSPAMLSPSSASGRGGGSSSFRSFDCTRYSSKPI